ncbi:hypothetical protein [Sphingomicrobium flavum]|uniref:hypothetical protein n=1 Tax=Sphingomicrobium flavum TaxID=1229164 RepID=UPI0021AD8B49|nr:hypothetical protein [Sphingomicrobium flavum]
MGQAMDAKEGKQAALEMMVAALNLLDQYEAPTEIGAHLSQSVELLRSHLHEKE